MKGIEQKGQFQTPKWDEMGENRLLTKNCFAEKGA